MHSRPKRIAVLTNLIPPYRRPVFEALQAMPDVDLRIILSSTSQSGIPPESETLPVVHAHGINFSWRTKYKALSTTQKEQLHIPIRLPRELMRFDPDLVVSGEFGPRSAVALATASLRRTPLVIWTEETIESAKGISWMQRLLRSWLIPRASGFLAWGTPAVAYLRANGVPSSKTLYCAQAVDNEFWRKEAAKYDKRELRSRLNVRGRVFLAVGRLVQRKGFDRLLLAWSRLKPELRESNTLLIVGTGPEDSKLREIIAAHRLINVEMLGAHYAPELAKYYALADVFVFPSLVDVWGLVVNEAMACGLPVLGSRYAGASQQLIKDGVNGCLIDPMRLDALTETLSRWCEAPLPFQEGAPLASAKELSFEVTVSAFREALAMYSRS